MWKPSNRQKLILCKSWLFLFSFLDNLNGISIATSATPLNPISFLIEASFCMGPNLSISVRTLYLSKNFKELFSG